MHPETARAGVLTLPSAATAIGQTRRFCEKATGIVPAASNRWDRDNPVPTAARNGDVAMRASHSPTWTAGMLAGVTALLLAGCSPAGVSSGGGDCTSHYRQVAHASNAANLRNRLLATVPRATSLRQVGSHRSHPSYQMLTKHGHMVMVVDIWRRPDNTWVAGQWMQCID